jgi:hypothetical protein
VGVGVGVLGGVLHARLSSTPSYVLSQQRMPPTPRTPHITACPYAGNLRTCCYFPHTQQHQSPTLPYAAGPFADVLARHNHYRELHAVPNLVWDTTLASKAQAWADNCKWARSVTSAGENLAMGYSSQVAAVDAWYDEVSCWCARGSPDVWLGLWLPGGVRRLVHMCTVGVMGWAAGGLPGLPIVLACTQWQSSL